ncbi:MAG: D-alanyl-D-alanine carboxypeptidase family protein [Clostridia bacterium]|nr:D-alanyl-D-alanine carboxypeptidase family protein [Clostridia bacterium]
MSKKRGADAYGKLVRILIVLFVLTVICGAGYMLLDQSIKAQETENAARAQQENDRLQEAYRQAKAEEQAAVTQEETPAWPTPKQEGWDVIDVSNFPLSNTKTYTATRQELITSGMLLVNRWHSVPDDLAECEFLGVHATDKTIPTDGSKVKLLSPAITALGNMLSAAKAEGLEHYNVEEGYRLRATQQQYYDTAAAKYADSLTGENLINKVVSEGVSVPGTSEYESGLSFRMGRYLKGDDIMNYKFHELPQSDWMVEHSWEYGLIFRFPVQGYPNATVTDKSYKTGQSSKLSIYRYVGVPNAAVMHIMNFCMEEYIEYLIAHPHIAVYKDGVLKYEIVRVTDYGGGSATVNVTRSAREVIVSVDNMEGYGMGGLIVAMAY